MLLWTYIVLISFAAMLEVLCILRGLWYVKVTFPKKMRPDFIQRHESAKRPLPRVSLFIPCKGMSPDLEENIHAILDQDYPDYEVFCITESKYDPAAPFLNQAAGRHHRLHHVIAGRATRCCQKNENLISGIEYAKQSQKAGEIYVFADMDIRPSPDWLRNMILPLSDPDVFAVSGFRALTPRHNRFPEHLHAAFSAFQGMAMTDPLYAAMWGGSMAIRRMAFETYAVQEKWASAMVDDMALTSIIKKYGLKRIFSPDCLVSSRETYPELNRVMAWLVRQTQYAAIYLRPYTALGLCLNSVLSICMIMCPITWFLANMDVVPNILAFYHAAIYLLVSVGISLLGGFVRQKGIKIRWFLYAPLFLVLGVCCGWIGFFSKRLSWADMRYQVNRSGEVLMVEKLVLSETE